MGTKKKTKLPDSTFERIISNKVFHELEYPDKMLDDISEKLKENGFLCISDMFSTKDRSRIEPGCQLPAYSTEEVIRIANRHEFYLTRMTHPESYFQNTLIFKKSKTPIENIKRKNTAEELLLEMFGENIVASDSSRTIAIADSLLRNSGTLNHKIEYFINGFGYDWINDRMYQNAINVFKANVKLFPKSGNVYESLGEGYFYNREYSLALINYQKSLEIDPDNIIRGKELQKIEEIKKIIEAGNSQSLPKDKHQGLGK